MYGNGRVDVERDEVHKSLTETNQNLQMRKESRSMRVCVCVCVDNSI